MAVSNAAPQLSCGISHLTYLAAYAPFTPSNSDQCLHPPYYRSCWHGVSRCFFTKYPQIKAILLPLSCSLAKELYNPKAFFVHTASLRQACAHCERFSTAATRRCLGSVSVPVLAVNLSIRLDVFALVGRYPTNKLISHGLLSNYEAFRSPALTLMRCLIMPHSVLAAVSSRYSKVGGGLSMYY